MTRGRVRHRRRIVPVAAVALLGAVVAVLSGPGAEPGGAAVPRSVELPYFWQATVEMAPPGAASVLFGGDGLGLDEDVFEGESSRLAVLGRNGDYRALRFPDHGGRAGQDVQLSPDGNLLAETVEVGDPPGWRLLVTDLRTGRSRDYVGSATSCCAQVVAWRPDNGAVLVLQAAGGYLTAGPPAQYVLVDLAGGAVTPIDDRLRRDWSTTAWAAAFAPDGHGFVTARRPAAPSCAPTTPPAADCGPATSAAVDWPAPAPTPRTARRSRC